MVGRGNNVSSVARAAEAVVSDEGEGPIKEGGEPHELKVGHVRVKAASAEAHGRVEEREHFKAPQIVDSRDIPAANEPEMSRVAFWLRGRRVYPYNSVQLLIDGEQAYPAMLDAIASAKRSIVLESYIFAADKTGARFRDALVERARADVSVRVMIDGLGSLYTDPLFWKPLIAVGGRVEYHQPIQPWRQRWGLWRRDHRKVLVIDDVVGFIGGINIADDYAPESWGGRAWHDVHAHVEGPAVRELVRLFNRQWRRITGEHWNATIAHPQKRGHTTLQILESALTRRYSVRRAYLRAIRRARTSIRICNAYCIPDMRFRHALRDAVKRGVKVQLLVAGKTDVIAVRYASRALYARMMNWGIEIYEWTERVLHAKTAVIDGEWCTIGSYNIDARSLLHNLEANIAAVDKRLGAAMDQTFEKDIAKSQRIDPERWHRRPMAEKVVEGIFYMLRIFL
jgi:cardiolipin synthase